MTTKKPASLSAEDIATTRTGRRSAMIMIGAVVATVTAQGCATGCTDRDTGTGADPANSGRRCSTRCTDTDSGSSADRAGSGRRC